jgi:hypothetical protein
MNKLTPLKKRHFILPIPFLTLGIACIVFGIYGSIDSQAVRRRAIQVPGTIIGTVKHTYGRDWRLSTFSRFRFKTTDGRIISHLDEFPDSYDIGERVTVVYDPQNPRAVYINQLPPWSWKTTVIAILVGVLFLGGAVVAWSGA